MKPTREQEEDSQKMADTPDLPNFSKAGTGKTLTTLLAIKKSRLNSGVVFAPKIALDWWKEQAENELGADVKVIRSGKTKLGADIHVMTYDVARNRRTELYEYFSKGFAVLDESHLVASVTSGRSAAMFGNVFDGAGGLVSCFDTAWLLSGTPMQNYANDMWTQVGVLHPDEFEAHGVYDYADFERNFCFKRKVQYNPRMQPKWVVKGNMNEMLLNRIIYEDIGAIRRLEAPGLPDLLMRNLVVDIKLEREVAKTIDRLDIAELLRTLGDPDSIGAKVWRIVGLAKVSETVPYVRECAMNGPLLLGCWHRDVMQAYEDALSREGLTTQQVHGGTADNELTPIRRKFNNGQIDVLIGQMKKMGVSWNIQEAARQVIVAETHPSPATIEQFYKRVYRFGQTRSCQVDVILSNNKLDMGLNNVRLRKQQSDRRINQ